MCMGFDVLTHFHLMKKVLFGAMLCAAVMASAQNKIEMLLWDETPESTTEEELALIRDNDFNKNPALTVYVPARPNGTAIIMCPGGGYGWEATGHEGHDMAEWFNGQGVTYAVVKYRLPQRDSKVPLADVEEAIRLMRAHADEWGVNLSKVGIMGASAGGHLASTAATHYSSAESRPDFQVLFYPVITMDPTYTHMGSRENLLGVNPSKELQDKFSNELQVNAETPQAFIMASSDDTVVPIANSINYYNALVANKVPVALHIYPTGGHGWGYGDGFLYKRQWTGELEKWLRQEVTDRR